MEGNTMTEVTAHSGLLNGCNVSHAEEFNR
jgi:hypothetical protein